MTDKKKVLQMNFATADGGSLRISVNNTRDNVTVEEIKTAMDTVVSSNIFLTSSGEVVQKTRARYVTQEIENLDIA